jgi:hypothetical protein
MASPAPKPPAGTPNDEALDILRRLEPVLFTLDDRTQRIEAEQKEQRRDIATLKEGVARLEGRMTGIEGQLRQIPTLYQLAGLIFAIFGAAFMLIRFASGH